jgi:hypothetical protein
MLDVVDDECVVDNRTQDFMNKMFAAAACSLPFPGSFL